MAVSVDEVALRVMRGWAFCPVKLALVASRVVPRVFSSLQNDRGFFYLTGLSTTRSFGGVFTIKATDKIYRRLKQEIILEDSYA